MPDLRTLLRAHAAAAVVAAVLLAGLSTLVYAAVVRHDRARLRLTAGPVSRNVTPGKTATFALRVRRTRFSGSVRLRVIGTVPTGVTTTLSFGRRRSCARSRYHHRVCWYPTTARQTRVNLTVKTTSRTRTGTFRVRVQGLRYRGGASATLSVFVVVRGAQSGVVGGQGEPTPAPAPAPSGGTPAPDTGGPTGTVATVPDGGGDEGEPFPIHGDVTGLAPGVARPIDLELANDQDDARLVTALDVAQGDVTAPNADLQHPCSTADFQVAQMPPDAFPIVLPSGTHRLSELGVPVAQWPVLTMLDRPTDQDGCQHAAQQLIFTGQTAEAP